ncbi:AraC family transcriptional regulator [Verrucomicrobiales bacterium BCK34]|nr:AraC family transcriptional regulator [Verrucomicrobiales bacterium BCK34]
MPPDEMHRFQDAFFSQCPEMKEPIELMATMPNIGLFVKDLESRYVLNNDFHRIRYDRIAPQGLVGRRASEFFPPLLGEAYEANDRVVFESGKTIHNEIWLVPTIRGTPGWFLSGKSPIRKHDGSICGLLGLMYPIETPEEQRAYFGDLQKAIEYIDNHFTSEVTAAKLADLAGLSVPHFNRLFRRVLRLSPMEYVLSLRIQEAQRLLATTPSTMSEIGAATGFYDQSHFTKRFRKITGMTPLAYRRSFRK